MYADNIDVPKLRLLLENFQKRECKHISCDQISQALDALKGKSKKSSAGSPSAATYIEHASSPPSSTGASGTNFPIRPLIPAPIYSPAFPCVTYPKALFVRADPLDNFHYASVYLDPDAPTAADAKGLSVSYTDNRRTGAQAATINGRLSYLMFGAECNPPFVPPAKFGNSNKPFIGAVAIAPFIASNGTWNEPLPAKLSNSVLSGGADFQLGVSTTQFPLITYNYFYASPYYQTDYQQRARIDGAVFAWEPVSRDLHLVYGRPNAFFNFFWQLRTESDLVHVTQPGLTKLSVGDHVWIGETVRANLALFPLSQSMAWPQFVQEFVAGRLAIIGTAENYYDVETHASADYYTAALQYNLGACKRDGSNKDPNAPCSITGSSSISFEYDTGLDKDTLVETRQYLVKLGFAY